jgi:hypothetical protein
MPMWDTNHGLQTSTIKADHHTIQAQVMFDDLFLFIIDNIFKLSTWKHSYGDKTKINKL